MAWHLDKAIYAGGGGDYTTLQSFESAMDGEDASGTDGIRGRVKGNPADGNFVYWGGWQAGYDSDTWLVIEAESGSEADGMNDASGDDALLSAVQNVMEGTEAMYIKFRYLESNTTIGSSFSFNPDGGGEGRVIKCVGRDNSGVNGCLVTVTGVDSAFTVNIGGCLVKDNTGTYSTGIRCLDSDATVNVINCTVADMNFRGLTQTAGTATAKNCAIVNSGTDVNGTWTEVTNKSEDDGDITNDDADDFTEPSTEDYTIYDTNSNLYHTGTQIADSWFTEECATDLAGTTWNNPPSVGCFEYVAAGGNAPTGHFDGPLMGPFGGPI